MVQQPREPSYFSDNRGKKRNRITSLTISTKDHRWSEVVPPMSALTFAVIWDPEDGIIAFSGANLLDHIDNDTDSPISPFDASDGRSQVLTIGNSTIPLSENTATLAFFRDNHEFLFSTPSHLAFDQFRRTQTSSTLEGLDVYLRGSMFGKAHKHNRRYTFLRELETEFKFDPMTSFAKNWFNWARKSREDTVTDEGYEECPTIRVIEVKDVQIDEEQILSSAFSTTTTSTSNYVSIDINEVDDEGSSSWSTLEAPNTPGFSQLFFSEHQRFSRRLKKRRSKDAPAPPSEVLQRSTYNHTATLTSESPPPPCKHLSVPNFVRSLSLKKWRPLSTKDQWVCVELSQQITQRCI